MKLAKQFLMIAAIVAITLTYGCKKETPDNNETQPTIAVTYSLLNGAWELVAWDGAPLAEGTYLYVEFDRTEHRYTMWDNLNSMYATDTSGTFTITEEEDGSYILSGTYDYGVGDWHAEYRVELSNGGDRMQWWSKSTNEVMDFVRIAEIPEIY